VAAVPPAEDAEGDQVPSPFTAVMRASRAGFMVGFVAGDVPPAGQGEAH
jgi:hypothetical protein